MFGDQEHRFDRGMRVQPHCLRRSPVRRQPGDRQAAEQGRRGVVRMAFQARREREDVPIGVRSVRLGRQPVGEGQTRDDGRRGRSKAPSVRNRVVRQQSQTGWAVQGPVREAGPDGPNDQVGLVPRQTRASLTLDVDIETTGRDLRLHDVIDPQSQPQAVEARTEIGARRGNPDATTGSGDPAGHVSPRGPARRQR
jgi:hypothetical protein